MFEHAEALAKAAALGRQAAVRAPAIAAFGAITEISGLSIRVADRAGALEVGSRLLVESAQGSMPIEAVGVSEGFATCMPFGSLDGLRRGLRVRFEHGASAFAPSRALLGRVVDALGRPIDGKGPIAPGRASRLLRAPAPPAAKRARLGAEVDFGIRALDAFAPMRAGQRVGIFSGSGVGKSSLLAMMARNCDCDSAVIALIGERGREVRDFIEDCLGPEGLARAVVVVATSDEPAMMRREAAYMAMTIAEQFRDEGDHVLCVMDSLTRVAMAQREIGLAVGEPPTAKGYTPSVFSVLPSVLERAGPGLEGAGAITGVFSVLVEGGDHDEPIADAARAILDGHIVLSRKIAERGRFPAVDILRSLSRSVRAGDDRARLASAARKLESIYEDMSEMIRIGAYQAGANAEVDRAIAFHGALESILQQSIDERESADRASSRLELALTQVGERP
jgi:flagellum-specific ATP synthase